MSLIVANLFQFKKIEQIILQSQQNISLNA
jgi:hypothetical protein